LTLFRGRRRKLIGLYNGLDDGMPNHVTISKMSKTNPFGTLQYASGVNQAGIAPNRQVNLSNVSGNNRATTET
jgi:hypothetical protein